ncbi:hypothetical protein [Magnetospirillum molischianum]|uniref:hypothetical protein n=1 Tax=Magnetospirillum molischianum TaxID=1083 RepID=UPI001F3E41E0|nr:hypothetical protein [Magnetospirillum molischianum]
MIQEGEDISILSFFFPVNKDGIENCGGSIYIVFGEARLEVVLVVEAPRSKQAFRIIVKFYPLHEKTIEPTCHLGEAGLDVVVDHLKSVHAFGFLYHFRKYTQAKTV